MGTGLWRVAIYEFLWFWDDIKRIVVVWVWIESERD